MDFLKAVGIITAIMAIGAAIGAAAGALSYFIAQHYGIISIGITAGIFAVVALLVWWFFIFRT